MDGDGRHPLAHAQLDAGEQVTVERVHAARAEQPDEVEGAARLPELAAELDQGGKLVELPALDALGDPHEVLRHHPAGAEVEVADLAVPHLPFGQADGQAAGVQQGPRVRRPEPVPDRRRGQLDRVAVVLAPVAPAVQHDQDDPLPGAAV